MEGIDVAKDHPGSGKALYGDKVVEPRTELQQIRDDVATLKTLLIVLLVLVCLSTLVTVVVVVA